MKRCPFCAEDIQDAEIECKHCESDLIATVQEAIAEADRILPGRAAPEGDRDPRWQSAIRVGNFIRVRRDIDPVLDQHELEAVWTFIRRWGCSSDEDLRIEPVL
jgi:hypothetical protein